MRFLTSFFIFNLSFLSLFVFLSLLHVEGSVESLALITVNSTLDGTDVNPGDGVCETAVSNNICTLRAAIQETNALKGRDEIILPSGTYLLTIAGGNENSAATGDLDILDELIISGASASNTIIDGNGIDRVFDVVTTFEFMLNNTTVQGGLHNSEPGGGIFLLNGTLTISNTVVQNNTAVGGGGIAFVGSGTFAMVNSTVNGNHAGNAPGGGLYINAALATIDHGLVANNTAVQGGGVVINTGSLTLTESMILTNTAVTIGGGLVNGAETQVISSTIQNNVAYENSIGSGSGGGGIFNIPAGILSLRHSTIHSNTIASDEGGGIYNLGILVLTDTQVTNNLAYHGGGIFNATGTFTATNSTVENNEALFYGGGIWNEQNGSISGSLIQKNVADDRGGGLYNKGMTSLEGTQFMQNSSPYGGAIFGENAQILGNNLTIDKNDAFAGGGIYLITSTLTLTNSTLSRNTAGDEASALVTAWGNGSFTNVTVSGNEVGGTGATIYIQEQDYSIMHSTIVSNTAPNGAIYIHDDRVTATLKNSIVANNSGGNCGGFVPVSAGYNLESANDCGLNSTGDLTNEDPHLTSLQNNGGATFTHALFPNSSAIDNGDGALSFDQRGVTRPQGDRVDIGAFEIEQHSLTVENTGAGGDRTITSIPVGINCGSSCVETFVSNTAVSLTATVGDNTIFVGWDGAGCSGTGDCVVTMDDTKIVTATFANHYQIWLPIVLKT